MNSKYVTWIVVAVVLVAGIAFFASRKNTPSEQAMAPQSSDQTAANTGGAQTSPSSQPTAPAGGSGISQVDTNTGSVAGVGLSEFSNQANDSASLSTQDGSSDAQAMSNDGAAINSATDSVSAPQ